MTLKIIKDTDVEALKVSSLPSRPTAPKSFGGAGYTAKEMKAAFDRLPLYIIERLNEIIEAVGDEDGIIADMPSGIREGHTLKQLIEDVTNGNLSSYLNVLGRPLSQVISDIEAVVNELKESDESEIDSITGAITALETSVASLAEKVRDIRDETALLETKYVALISDTDLISERCSTLESQAEATSERCDSIESSLSALSEKQDEDSQKSEQHEQDITELRESIQALSEKHESDLEALPAGSKIQYISDDYVEITVNNNDDIRMGPVEYFDLLFNRTGDDFSAVLSFTSSDYGTTINIITDETMLWSGRDVVDGVFEPCEFVRYTIFFWYDIVINCHVRGCNV